MGILSTSLVALSQDCAPSRVVLDKSAPQQQVVSPLLPPSRLVLLLLPATLVALSQVSAPTWMVLGFKTPEVQIVPAVLPAPRLVHQVCPPQVWHPSSPWGKCQRRSTHDEREGPKVRLVQERREATDPCERGKLDVRFACPVECDGKQTQ